MEEKVLILVRGVPGCGKSTFAKLLGDYICSADHFMMVGDKYEWSVDKLPMAHRKCFEKVETGMKTGIRRIILDNTSVKKKDMKMYFDLALAYGYKVFSVIVENRHGGTNVHGVPDEKIQKMVESFDIQLA